MPNPRKIIDTLRSAGIGGKAKAQTRWDQIKKAAYITSTVYGLSTPVRREDGSIDAHATAVKYLNIARGQTGHPAYPPVPEWLREKLGIQEVGEGGGMITSIPPQWYADP